MCFMFLVVQCSFRIGFWELFYSFIFEWETGLLGLRRGFYLELEVSFSKIKVGFENGDIVFRVTVDKGLKFIREVGMLDFFFFVFIT